MFQGIKIITESLKAFLLKANGVAYLIVDLLTKLLLLVPLSLVELDAFLGHADLFAVGVNAGLLYAGEGLSGLQLHLEGVDLCLNSGTITGVVSQQGLEFLHLPLVGHRQLINVNIAVTFLVFSL